MTDYYITRTPTGQYLEVVEGRIGVSNLVNDDCLWSLKDGVLSDVRALVEIAVSVTEDGKSGLKCKLDLNQLENTQSLIEGWGGAEH